MATLNERFNLAAEAGIQLSVSDIKAVCADYFEVTIDEIMAQRKSQRCVIPRYTAYYLAMKFTQRRTGELAVEFNRSASAITTGTRVLERRLEHDLEVRFDLGQVFDRLIAYA